MADFTDSIGFNKGVAAYPDEYRTHMFDTVLDFGRIAVERTRASAPQFDTGDTLEVMVIPAGSVVLAAGVEVITPEGAAATADLGTAATPDAIFATADLNVAGNAMSALARTFFDVDTPVLMTFDAPLGTAKVRPWALVVDANSYGTTFVSGRNLGS